MSEQTSFSDPILQHNRRVGATRAAGLSLPSLFTRGMDSASGISTSLKLLIVESHIVNDLLVGNQGGGFGHKSCLTPFIGLGDDYLNGGLGKDILWGHGGNYVIDGGGDNDQLNGDGILKPGYYQSLAETQHGNDVLDSGAGDDQLKSLVGQETTYSGAVNDCAWVLAA